MLALALAACASEASRAVQTPPVPPDVSEPEASPTPAPKYYGWHIDRLAPGREVEYADAIHALADALLRAGPTAEDPGWITLEALDGRMVRISPMESLAAGEDGLCHRARVEESLGVEQSAALHDALDASLLFHHTQVCAPFPILDLNADREPLVPGFVRVLMEWPKPGRESEYLYLSQRIRDICIVYDYPLTLRHYRAIYGDWGFIQVQEAESAEVFRTTPGVNALLNRALGAEAASELLQRREATVARRDLLEAHVRPDLAYDPTGGHPWLAP
jgi:hypothetical protein